MKLSTWAKTQGISYRTAHRLFSAGKLPVPASQLETGTILVHPDQGIDVRKIALYGRVSSHDQKGDLERQMERLRQFAAANGLCVDAEYSEIGSGLNGRRKKLIALLQDKTIGTIIVEHRDRLARFGVEYIEAATDKQILVLNETEKTDDLVQDFVDVVTSMCARIYGRRSAKNRAKKALDAASEN